jgi:hypothetical protein
MGTVLQMIFMPIFVIGIVVYFRTRQQKMLATSEQNYANFRLSDLAPRVRLSIVEGDPGFNLMMASTTHDLKSFDSTGGVIGAIAGDGTKTTRALLRGAPTGRPTEISYLHKTDLDVNPLVRQTRTTFECRLSVQVARPFPPFEIALRNPGMGCGSPPVMSLPAASFGDPALDARWTLFAVDPRVGPAIAPVLAPLASMHQLHVRAHDQSIGFFATQIGLYGFLTSVEQVQYALDQVGLILEGRPAAAMVS